VLTGSVFSGSVAAALHPIQRTDAPPEKPHPCEALHTTLTHSLLVFELQTLEDIVALESEYFPEQTCRLSSLSPEARRAYKKILWGLLGFYTAAIVTMGVVVVENTNFQKAANVVMTGLWPR